jgi:hypothetical protein
LHIRADVHCWSMTSCMTCFPIIFSRWLHRCYCLGRWMHCQWRNTNPIWRHLQNFNHHNKRCPGAKGFHASNKHPWIRGSVAGLRQENPSLGPYQRRVLLVLQPLKLPRASRFKTHIKGVQMT